ncbi:hypothetical protein N7495_004576 [Penicillium taxi]|uniref:uncharacterized protein n=1 Tax=Penicillium taxi TaxID=168475 RepID=UPI00254503E3|nr:uncharacterized protein N7495_004576 [Penicillium taxi]KAJ5899832.1 hypothetical protein N7495_004576 [Penicillium taxi]
MSNDRRSSPITVPESVAHPRRGSFASSLPFTDLFSKQNNQAAKENVSNQTNQRRVSITTLGLSGSPTQPSALGFGNQALRRGSLSSSWGSGAQNEDILGEDTDGPAGVTPSSPFARRVSFGAQALRDARSGSIGNGEGFNWSEALRSRAERAPSISGQAHSPQNHARQSSQSSYQRAASIAVMEQPPNHEIHKHPKHNSKPDYFQEKILRGDFMD